MWKRSNIFESTFVLSTVCCILLTCLQYLTGFFGVWLSIYTALVFVLSIFVSFRALQNLLVLNAPIKYEEVFKDSRWKFLGSLLPVQRFYPKDPVTDEWNEYDTSELSVISTVLERKLVSSWYVQYVSQDIGFPFACKEMLDQLIGKSFQITHKVDTPALYTDICSVLLSHLNEYKRAVKLLQLSKEENFEPHYRMIHPVFSAQDGVSKKRKPSAEHCANILRVVMKELIPFDLWDTPHSELLIRILTKRMDNFIKDTLSHPNWLNHKILQILRKKNSKEPQNKSKKDFHIEETEAPETEPVEKAKVVENIEKPTPEVKIIAPEPIEVAPPITTSIELALSHLITKSTAPILQNAIADQIVADTSEAEIKTEKISNDLGAGNIIPFDIKMSPILRQRRGRQGKNEVKIYDRIIEGSVKTWESDVDLRCISVGQDLLASLDGEISLSRLWETDNAEMAEVWSPNPQMTKSPPALWFGEEDAMDLELDDSPPKPSSARAESTNFTLSGIHNMRDLQSTVNQAKHKIGDLQDEAAGMMEGILDFGIAGLKKGLRLTGLHEGQDKLSATPISDRSANGRGTPTDVYPARLAAAENGLSRKSSSSGLAHSDAEEVNGVNSTNSFLVKQHRVTSQDSVPRPIPGKSDESAEGGAGGGGAEGEESPEPQYEEAADFASSIAKLRSLLQQHTADTPPKWSTEGVRWEGAEETRGRTQDARHAGRPVDQATLADEYDLSAERSPILGQSTNNMQRLDKLLQRTVTGVLNSIKTAVGGEGEEAGGGAGPVTPPGEWQYVCTSLDLSVGGGVARLVAARRAHTVDAGLDSLEMAPPASTPPSESKPAPPPLDLEEWCAGPGGCWSGAAELAAAAGLWQSHVTHTIVTVLLADVAEGVIRAWLRELSVWLRRQIFIVFEEMAQDEGAPPRSEDHEELDVNKTCDAILEVLPGPLWLLGEDTLRNSLQLGMRSLGSARVNADLAYRLIDVLALHFTRAANARPIYEAV